MKIIPGRSLASVSTFLLILFCSCSKDSPTGSTTPSLAEKRIKSARVFNSYLYGSARNSQDFFEYDNNGRVIAIRSEYTGGKDTTRLFYQGAATDPYLRVKSSIFPGYPDSVFYFYKNGFISSDSVLQSRGAGMASQRTANRFIFSGNQLTHLQISYLVGETRTITRVIARTMANNQLKEESVFSQQNGSTHKQSYAYHNINLPKTIRALMIPYPTYIRGNSYFNYYGDFLLEKRTVVYNVNPIINEFVYWLNNDNSLRGFQEIEHEGNNSYLTLDYEFELE